MATDATGTPSTLSIPKYNTSADAPSGRGLNAIVDAIDTLLAARVTKATLTTTGDTFYASSANTPARLAIGSTGQILTVAGGIPSWATQGSYTAYTPTWTASGTPPAIGNATVAARYAQFGKIVHAYGLISFGTTSTYGTNNYSFALPVTASTSGTYVTGTALLYDASASAAGHAIAFLTTTTTMTFQYAATYLGTLTQAGQLVPWTWTTSDIISWNIVYEAA